MLTCLAMMENNLIDFLQARSLNNNARLVNACMSFARRSSMCLITLPRPKVFSTVLPDSLELFVPSSHSSGLEDVSDLTRARLGGAVLLVAPDVEICTDRSRLGNGGTGGLRRGSSWSGIIFFEDVSSEGLPSAFCGISISPCWRGVACIAGSPSEVPSIEDGWTPRCRRGTAHRRRHRWSIDLALPPRFCAGWRV